MDFHTVRSRSQRTTTKRIAQTRNKRTDLLFLLLLLLRIWKSHKTKSWFLYMTKSMTAVQPAVPPHHLPPQWLVLALYALLGAAASFFLGHEPGTLPEDLVRALCPSIIVVSLFLARYTVVDVMSAGVTKSKSVYAIKDYKDMPVQMPEEAYLADRAQMNQLEQMPPFIMATMSFSLLVNGNVGAILALLWSVLRHFYARTYRRSVGLPFGKKGLASYTIPCYFITGTMLMGSAVHALRWMMSWKVY